MFVNLREISKKFRKSDQDFFALNRITLELENGKVYGLIGQNGAGKSTLIKILMGLYDKTNGEIFFEGKYVKHFPLDKVSYLPERFTFPNVPSLDLILYYGGLYLLPPHYLQHRILFLVKLLGFENNLNETPQKLSAGSLKKLAIIITLLPDVPLYILDEPTANLDPIFREVFFSEISRIKRKNNSCFIISSHGIEELYRNSDNIILLKDGSIIYSGEKQYFEKKEGELTEITLKFDVLEPETINYFFKKMIKFKICKDALIFQENSKEQILEWLNEIKKISPKSKVDLIDEENNYPYKKIIKLLSGENK